MASLVHQLKIIPKPVMGPTSWSQLGCGVCLWSLPFVLQPKLGPKQWGWKLKTPGWHQFLENEREENGRGQWEKEKSGREGKGAPGMLSKTKAAWGMKERTLRLIPLEHSKSGSSDRPRYPFSFACCLLCFMPKYLQGLYSHLIVL